MKPPEAHSNQQVLDPTTQIPLFRITPPSLLRTLSFGDPTAEADREFLFDRQCFLETDVYAACRDQPAPQFVVGRRGSGKTAMCLALHKTLSSQSTCLCTLVVPESYYFAHVKALARTITTHTDTNWEFLFTAIWATALRAQWSRQLLAYYKVRDPGDDDTRLLEEFLAEASPDPHESVGARLVRYVQAVIAILNSSEADKIAAITRRLVSYKAERVARSLRKVADASKVTLVTLVDGLDENWDGSNTSAELISGLLTQAAADYAAIGAKTVAFMRENMYRRVSNVCPRWDRLEGYFAHIVWAKEEIRELVLKRVAVQVPDGHPTWESVFEPTVEGMPSDRYILHRTQFKPREVILFCRYALDTARRHRAARIRAADVLEAESRYSQNRLRDLLNEYQDSFPELPTVVEWFVGAPQVMVADEFWRHLEETITSGRYAEKAPRLSLTYPNPDGVFELLMGIGFVGVQLHGGAEFVFKYYGEQGNVFKEIGDLRSIAIHPAFQQALALKTGGAHLPTKEAGEEDIVAAAPTLSARMGATYEKASELLSSLRDIPVGIGAFRRYEELLRAAAAYAFQGYLDNPHYQERNWAGTQIRDLVFDNAGETLFFVTIRNRHSAVTVPFECKNKLELDPADFHQIESRLSETTGHFGFVCYRAQRSEPLRHEIEQLRDIHNRDRRRVVLLLTDVKGRQLLERRIRGKLDKFLFRWYTDYLKLYLS